MKNFTAPAFSDSNQPAPEHQAQPESPCRLEDCFACPHPDYIASAKACEKSVTYPGSVPEVGQQPSPWGYIQPNRQAAQHVFLWLYELRRHLRDNPSIRKRTRRKADRG